MHPKFCRPRSVKQYCAPACCSERCVILVRDGQDGAFGNLSTQINSHSELNDVMRLVYFVSHDRYTCGVGADVVFWFP